MANKIVGSIYALAGRVEVDDDGQVQVIMGHDGANPDLWKVVAITCNKAIERLGGVHDVNAQQIIPLEAGESVEGMKALREFMLHASGGQLRLYQAASLPSPASV